MHILLHTSITLDNDEQFIINRRSNTYRIWRITDHHNSLTVAAYGTKLRKNGTENRSSDMFNLNIADLPESIKERVENVLSEAATLNLRLGCTYSA